MMREAVVDTNVILAANNKHTDLSDDCVEVCINKLTDLMKHGLVVIDDSYLILTEYQKQTNSNVSKGVGDTFVKWLLRNNANSRHCETVTITEIKKNHFKEFPDPILEAKFDASDRKFVAVANAHPAKPIILQAADSKWLNWSEDLRSLGIKVDFICPDDLCRFFQKKFPKIKIPEIPKF